jgi:hypothetical protein
MMALALSAWAIPPIINYQGLLTTTAGTPTDTTIAMTFKLYTDSTAGSLLWTESHPSVTVVNGLFNVRLGQLAALNDGLFANPQIWLGITVGADPEMTPRLRIVSVGYAYRAGTVDGASGGTISSDLWVQGRGNFGTGNLNSGTYAFVAGQNDSASGNYSTISGGHTNTASGYASSVDGGYHNTAGGYAATVNGGEYNTASNGTATVGGGYSNEASGLSATSSGGQSNIASGSVATVGGGQYNVAEGDYSVVAGGGNLALLGGNRATGDYSFIGGGASNETRAIFTTISGGWSNVADSVAATVGGGYSNSARGDAATVGGGNDNSTRGDAATVGGGYGNTASGEYSTIPGGRDNEATGYCSFAAGYNAHAIANGVFAWADNYAQPFSPGVENTFNARASGGVRFYTNATASVGARLPAGGSAWVVICDSTKKRNIRLADTKAILEKVGTLPIKQWSYKSQDPSIEHIGPMAQDFWNAFHLGEDSLGISTIDPDGIALAAIQELHKENQQLKKELTQLNEQVESLSAQLGNLKIVETISTDE